MASWVPRQLGMAGCGGVMEDREKHFIMDLLVSYMEELEIYSIDDEELLKSYSKGVTCSDLHLIFYNF